MLGFSGFSNTEGLTAQWGAGVGLPRPEISRRNLRSSGCSSVPESASKSRFSGPKSAPKVSDPKIRSAGPVHGNKFGFLKINV